MQEHVAHNVDLLAIENLKARLSHSSAFDEQRYGSLGAGYL